MADRTAELEARFSKLEAERDTLAETLKAVEDECHADINCGVDCDCEDYDGEWTYCLAHRILDGLAAGRAGTP